MMHRKVWLLVLCVTLYSANRSIASPSAQLEFSQENDPNAEDTLRPPFLQADHLRWADSVLHSLNQREQIAQLLMPPVYAHEDHKDWEVAEQWAQKGLIGGVICMQGHPQGQINRIQRRNILWVLCTILVLESQKT